ncbi:MAG: hypothetical protein COB93_02390 [Sneathiella sp.]|nr:MAG: hypothetical protein COB93_02390 [Sneathiella sp.]
MNKKRRKKVSALVERVAKIISDIEALEAKEKDDFDNLPENILSGQKGADMEAAIIALQEAMENSEAVIENLNQSLGSI